LSSEEVQQLFARIDEEDTVVALRDGALIGAMLYTFGRVGAVVAMRVKDYAPASAGKKVLCLREKGGKRHRVPARKCRGILFMTARRASIRDTQPTAAWGEGKTREGGASRDAGGLSPGRRGLQAEKAHPPEQVLQGRAISGRIFRHPCLTHQNNKNHPRGVKGLL
jgi:integrase